MRNLCDEWARALVDDLTTLTPGWQPPGMSIRPLATEDPKTRPCLLLHGTEEPRVHPRLAVGSILLELHWHRNDGTVEEGREILRLAALEMDQRRGGIAIPDAVMTWFMPSPDEELVVEDGWVFRASRDARFRAASVATA